jgi:two-component system, cell cycle sensor histidine kinase and response regulator CckA
VPQPLTRHTVLVVDDEEVVRYYIERILVGGGYRVITAIRGEEAVSLLHTGGDLIELVITDVRMPGMSGEDFARQMAQLSSAPPLLYISGGDPPAGAESARFLQKPFTREALLRAVEVVLQPKRG